MLPKAQEKKKNLKRELKRTRASASRERTGKKTVGIEKNAQKAERMCSD